MPLDITVGGDGTDPDGDAVARRRLLKAVGVGTTVGIAGCGRDGGNEDEDGDDDSGDAELIGPDGTQVELLLACIEGNDAVETAAEIIAAEVADLGVAVSLERVSYDRLLRQYVRNRYLGDGDPEWTAGPNNAGPREETASESAWDLMFGVAFNTYPRTPAAIDAFWLERAPTNYYGYVPEADIESRLEAFRTTTDPDERRAPIAEVLGALSEEQPVNFLAMSDDVIGYRRSVRGPVEAFGGNWDSATWYVDEDGDGNENEGGPTASDEWVWGVEGEAEGLYFPERTDSRATARINLTLDGAYDVDENGTVRPLWMDITDTGSGQVYVCELRDTLRWGDDYGRMTADDWVYQIENVHTIDGGRDHPWNEPTPPSNRVDDWAAVENVEQTSESEFQLELESVNPDFPLEPVLWGSYCAPKELYEAHVPDADALRASDAFAELSFTGNLGPYTLERWDRTQEFVTARNEEYYMREHADDVDDAWRDAPYFERYSYRVIGDRTDRLEALADGELTATSIPPERYADIREADAVEIYEIPQPFLTIVAYNQRANGWAELRTREVRQALSMAVEKPAITEDAFRGLAEWTHTFQPRWSSWYDDSQITPFGVDKSYDKDRARELLAEHTTSGYEYEPA
ncbi:ABC transporter substrate-binding protein [Haloterrigena salifodinae]|uniref:ABC transporter substrate-binding protein n=1 Tax=Haloterrigena salifodinae TaxID=2675099 RepID=UPI000F899395|nr:ABC transporter substrate-binding protein [Haloterrigena salifodinae]